ncbi:ABC transporter ATP-binding protein [Phytohabitans suffuscus]|uniref:ABC transporter ATP-binding protein n=1 Tax=Phytohabitans suffuscus TaxID=624315 RepID=A0A6F8YV89_9ACTN|nr:ABC transporter ATP-binding protein [Phytohabitans suffuscus]BCB89976.1 ABC transporter ATP-binding protein [Phytohabitans suffuscus]
MSAAVMRVDAVRKRFGGLVAVNDVSFTLGAGEVLGVVGPNGAGKSTLFDLVSGVRRPDAGTVHVGERDISGLPAHRVARVGLARTFQKLRPLAGLSVTDNVMVGAYCQTRRKARARSIAAECVEAVGLTHKANEDADRLSTGQRKRLEVARALATGPRILLLDEITAGVDPSGVPLLIELIHKLARMDLSIVVIEHRMRVILDVSHRLLAMHLGTVIAEGDPATVMRDPTVIERYLGRSYVDS